MPSPRQSITTALIALTLGCGPPPLAWMLSGPLPRAAPVARAAPPRPVRPPAPPPRPHAPARAPPRRPAPQPLPPPQTPGRPAASPLLRRPAALRRDPRVTSQKIALGAERSYALIMSVEVERATVPCGVCGARVSELRRGRCWGCYRQWAELRPVGRGASCVICQERRRDHLRLVELHSRSVPLCHVCAARTLKLDPVPLSLEALRLMLARDRRADERRGDGLDHRIFPRERRV